MSLPSIWRIIVIPAMVGLLHPALGRPPPEGLPITRNYTLDEIGDVSRGVRLNFDRIGRLAVIGSDAFCVLNDTTWLDIAYKGDDIPSMSEVVTDAAGNSYFGSLASWGVAEYTKEGELRPRSLRPEQVPEWVSRTGFAFILPHESGVFFAGLHGLVYWNQSTDDQVFFHVPGTTAVFALDSQVFVSSHSAGIQRLDLDKQITEPVEGGGVANITVDHAVSLGDGRSLVATITGRLMVFDGLTATPWAGPLGGEPTGRVTGLQRLSDGGIAVAVDGRGLFILSEDGEARLSLTSLEYQRIHDLAARETGVLWVATEGSVQKLLYGSPVTIVDRRLGVSISWPHIMNWDGRTVITSSGQLYEARPTADGLSIRFDPVEEQPPDGAWAADANGSRMLVGNTNGVFAREGDGFEQVVENLGVSRLVMVSSDLCYAIGTAEIAALQWENGRWSENVPRVPGVGFPSITHAAGRSAWIELGADRVARVSLNHEGLQTRVFDDFPWSDPRWVNIGVVDNTVVLSGGAAGYLFFDEETEAFRDAPELRDLFAEAPFPIARMTQDDSGNLWVTHENGVAVMRDPSVDTSSGLNGGPFNGIVREFQPLVKVLDGDDVWISTRRTLYHVNSDARKAPDAPSKPFLISVADRRTGTGLFSTLDPNRQLRKFSYAQNSLAFRFFSGSYAVKRPLTYEFTMSGGSSDWSTRSADSLLVLHDLKEGTYRLTARLIDHPGGTPEPAVVDFTIAPPWHRSPLAYAGYFTVTFMGGCGLFFWVNRRSRQKNAFLENLVRERTEELRATMIKLNDETRNAATLAERNRLAGEIHDSLQQGLSGLMLQLDATLKLSSLAPDVRSRLAVARNMVSFTRHEVQQAVWDLESRLLESADLTEGLKKMAGFISTGAPQVVIQTNGNSKEIPPSTKHHLLRIAQEAITNAVRHGNAERIDVRLHYNQDSATLEIRDDGCGFVPEEVFSNGIGHFGLRGLRGRASKTNADLDIVSAPGKGTSVKIEVPLTSDADAEKTHAAIASN